MRSESERESERERERERDYCGRRRVLIEAVRMAIISPQSATRVAISSGGEPMFEALVASPGLLRRAPGDDEKVGVVPRGAAAVAFCYVRRDRIGAGDLLGDEPGQGRVFGQWA